MLSKFRLALFRFHLKTLDPIIMPEFKGTTLRGALGSNLKKAACVFQDFWDRDCQNCSLEKNCVYRQVFETPKPKDDDYFAGMAHIPHPFAIEPPLETKQAYEQDESIDFYLILVGKAMKHWTFFVYAFSELARSGLGKRIEGRRGRCRLELVESLPDLDADKGKALYTHNSQEMAGTYIPIKLSDIFSKRAKQPKEIALKFLTPTRIQEDGKLQKQLTFTPLLKRLLQRISMLSYFHCDERLFLDYQKLIDKAEDKVKTKNESLEWQPLRRYSSRQEQKMRLGGLIGKIKFGGNLKDYLPFIYLGEYLHVGKNTAFGLGKYRVSDYSSNFD